MPPYPTQKKVKLGCCSGNGVFFALLGELFFFFFFWVTRVFLVGLSPFLSPAKKDKFVSNLFEGMWETYETPLFLLLLLRPQFRARRGFAITRVKEGGVTYLVKETRRYQVTYYHCFFLVCTVIIRIISFFFHAWETECIQCVPRPQRKCRKGGATESAAEVVALFSSLFSFCHPESGHPSVSAIPPPPPPVPVGPRLKFDKMLTISRTS